MVHAERLGARVRATDQLDARAFAWRAHDADLVQRHGRAAEGFDDGFLGGEAGGQRVGPLAKGEPLVRGEDAAPEAVAVAAGEVGDAFDFDDIDAGLEHASHSTLLTASQ